MKIFKPVLWNVPKSDGSRHIKIYIGEKRKKDYFPLGILTHADKLGNYPNFIDGRVANAAHINNAIRDALDRFQYLDLTHPGISIKEIKELFNQKEGNGFYDFYYKEVDYRKKKVSTNTGISYDKLTRSLEKFSKSIQFEQINYEWISKFEMFLREGNSEQAPLRQTTIYRRMKCLKMFLDEAIRLEKIKKNPFVNFKLKDGHANRQFLDKISLDKIRQAKGLTSYEQEARTKFLFQCYTGLSFSDMQDLKWSEIRDGVIYRERIKTEAPLLIPLIPQALEILESIKVLTQKVNVFTKISNQKYNIFLHAIEARAEISLPLTSHIARHTFATLALDAGVSMAVVSSILGHTNIRTTQIYGKITKKLKEEEMKKLRF